MTRHDIATRNSSKDLCFGGSGDLSLLFIISHYHDDPGWWYVCLWSLESASPGGWCLTGPGCLTLDTGHWGSPASEPGVPESCHWDRSPNIFHWAEEKLSALQIYSHLLSRAVHFISSVHQVSHLIWFVHSEREWRIDLSLWTLSCEYKVVSNSYITRHTLFIRFLLILIIIAKKDPIMIVSCPDWGCVSVRRMSQCPGFCSLSHLSVSWWWYPHYPQKKEDMSEALPCRSPNEAQLNIQTNEVRAQNIFQHRPAQRKWVVCQN